jgi:hypothetical protein
MNFNPHKLGIALAAGYLAAFLTNILLLVVVLGGSLDQPVSTIGSLFLLQGVSGYIFGYLIATLYNKIA